MSALTGATSFRTLGNARGYAFEAQGTQHVNCQDFNGHVHEFWWSAQNGWGHRDLTQLTGAPPAFGDPWGYPYEAQSTQHVVYRGNDNHVHELWWSASNGWGHTDLTAATGAPQPAGDPSAYVFAAQGTQHVNYFGVDNHIHELYWTASGGWSHNDLTAAAGAPQAAGNPRGYVFAAQNTQHVNYLATDDHIHELCWDSAGWHDLDLTAATGAPEAGSSPCGYMFDAQGTQHVNYVDLNGHVHELCLWIEQSWQTIPAQPSGGESGSYNYVLWNNCGPLQNPSIVFKATSTIDCKDNWDLQVNCYGPSSAQQGQSSWMQYVIAVLTTGVIQWSIEYWTLSGPNLFNTGDFPLYPPSGLQPLPANTFPKGYSLRVLLMTDPVTSNVTSVEFSVSDEHGHKIASKTVAMNDSLAQYNVTWSNNYQTPLIAIVPNLVGENNLNPPAAFAAGCGGNLVCTANSISATIGVPSCCSSQGIVTGESSDMTYSSAVQNSPAMVTIPTVAS